MNHLGFPLQSVIVAIGENGEHGGAFTSQDGRFTVAEVDIPHKVWLMCSAWSSGIAGQHSGDAVPQPADHLARVAFCAPDFHSATGDAEVLADGSFAWTNLWAGRSIVTGGTATVRLEAANASWDRSTANRVLAPATSEVSRTPFTGGVHIFAMSELDSGGKVIGAYSVVTAAMSFTKPEWPGQSSHRFVWGVTASTLYPTVDAAAGGPIDFSDAAAAAA